MNPETTRSCPDCGTLVPAGFPDGLCPLCLLRANPSDDDVGAGEGRADGIPPLETVRALFPELEVQEVLGAGGMGAVYRARQPRLDRVVALKIMIPAAGKREDFALRFEQEARVLARLSHPHIVAIHDFGERGTEPLFYFLMEHVDGPDLGQLIKLGELEVSQALAMIRQICEALQYAHDQGITHRDIKPANLLIDRNGSVKIADFGLARITSARDAPPMTGLTRTGTAMGTPHYMAPEQWEQTEAVDHRADIYALGVVFYEMLTGERPAGVFAPPSRINKAVDRRVDGVVLKAMEKEPGRRYGRVAEMSDALAVLAEGQRRNPPGASGKELPWRRAVAMVAAGLVAFFGWLLWLREGATRGEDASLSGRAVLAKADAGVPGGKDSQPPSRIEGRLRGAGFHRDGRPLDLKNAEGISDFVQVILTDLGWVGLRANGEQVTDLNEWKAANVVRLLPAWYNSYGIIKRDGTLGIIRLASPEVKAVPEEVQRIGVVDALWDDGQAIALLKDGSARVWGEHYTTAKEGPRWPAPPDEALRNVRAFAIADGCATTLRSDGSWHAWGGNGSSAGPFDLTAFSTWGAIADLQPHYESFRVLTREGRLFELNGNRPLESALVAENIGAIRDSFFLPIGEPVWQWGDRFRTSAKNEVAALLRQIGNRPRDAWDLRILGDMSDSRVSAVWIEEVN